MSSESRRKKKQKRGNKKEIKKSPEKNNNNNNKFQSFKKKVKKKKKKKHHQRKLKQGGVSQCGLAIYIKKYLKAKEEELWKLKYYISPCKNNYNLSKKSSKRKPKSFKILLLL